jgi:hypothetical protein
VIKGKNQYRLYTRSGDILTCTLLTPNPQVLPSDVGFTRSGYLHQITAIGGGVIGTEDVFFFGTSDGYVMREDVGPNFDGNTIAAVLRLPFASFKSPSNKKRFRKLVLELDAPQTTVVNFRELFDYADGTYNASIPQTAIAFGGGGQYDASSWDNFRWSLPAQTQAEANISGVGRNMALLIWHSSALDDSFIMQGLVIHYTVMGLTR